MFIDCLYVNIRRETETVNAAIYVVLTYDLCGKKDILSLWIVNKRIKVHVLNMGLMDDTPTGKLIRTILLAFAEFERDMILESFTNSL